MYVYINTETSLWTVGFYDPSGKWHTDSDHENTESAAARVHYLNGGNDNADPGISDTIRRNADASRYQP